MSDVSKYEDKLHASGELLEGDVTGEQWPQKYGTDDKTVAKHRKGRQEAVRDIIAGQAHHLRFMRCIDEIEAIDEEDPYAHVRIAKWSKAADLRFKAMGKYVPDVKAVTIDATPEAQAVADGISRAADLVERIIGRRIQKDVSGTVPSGSVVSTQVRSEAEGS